MTNTLARHGLTTVSWLTGISMITARSLTSSFFIFFYIGVDYMMTANVSFNVICGKQTFVESRFLAEPGHCKADGRTCIFFFSATVL